MDVKVSVVIPVYNKEAYLPTCLKSVQMQSLKQLEIICVDDGSTDRSLEVLKNIKKEDERIIILQQRNMGPGMARNRGLEEAKGEFVHFLDADDYYMDETSLERLYQAGIDQDVSVAGGMFYVDNNGCVTQNNIFGTLLSDMKEGRKVFYKNYQYDFYQYDFIFRKEFLMKHGLKFPVYRIYEDPPFFVQAMTAAEEFYILPVPFYCYRQTNRKRVYSAMQIMDLLLGLKDNLCFSAEHGLKKLHRITYYRINEWYLSDIVKCINTENVEILQLLLKLNTSVKWNWIEEKEAVKMHLLKPLALIMKCIEENIIFRNITGRKYIFPFNKVERDTKIALYGAGLVGNEYYDQLLKSDKHELVLWLDRNADKIHNDFYEISKIQSLYSVPWDYIVIAIANIEVALSVRENLFAMGVAKEKIIWSIEYNDYFN